MSTFNSWTQIFILDEYGENKPYKSYILSRVRSDAAQNYQGATEVCPQDGAPSPRQIHDCQVRNNRKTGVSFFLIKDQTDSNKYCSVFCVKEGHFEYLFPVRVLGLILCASINSINRSTQNMKVVVVDLTLTLIL